MDPLISGTTGSNRKNLFVIVIQELDISRKAIGCVTPVASNWGGALFVTCCNNWENIRLSLFVTCVKVSKSAII